MASTLKNVCSSIPFALLAQSPLAELRLDQEGNLQRCRRALVWHPGDADHDPAPSERVEGVAQLEGRRRGVEVVCLLVEVLDLLGDDPRTGRDHELVVADGAAVVHLHLALRLVDADGLAYLELDLLVEEAALRPRQALCPLASHGDVHEARLVDVVAHLVDQGHARFVTVDVVAQLPHQQVCDERPPDATAQDHNAVHGGAS